MSNEIIIALDEKLPESAINEFFFISVCPTILPYFRLSLFPTKVSPVYWNNYCRLHLNFRSIYQRNDNKCAKVQ